MTISGARAIAWPVARLPKGTLQDHVYRQCCEMLLSGEIAPGQLVTIQALSDAFGVSAMPVREALQRLIAAKALTVISSRSIGVPHLTRERLLDLKRVRLEVESLAAQWAVTRIAAKEIGELEVLVAQMASAAAAINATGIPTKVVGSVAVTGAAAARVRRGTRRRRGRSRRSAGPARPAHRARR